MNVTSIFRFFIFFIVLSSFLWSEVSDSVIHRLDHLSIESIISGVSQDQKDEIHAVLSKSDQYLRVMSFNILSDDYDGWIEDERYSWEVRKGRIKEYLNHTLPDIIGTQELASQESPRAAL